jgi:hypothetical protein
MRVVFRDECWILTLPPSTITINTDLIESLNGKR